MRHTIPEVLRVLRKNLPTNFPVKWKWVEWCDDKAVATCCLITRPKKQPHFLIELSHARLDQIAALEGGFGFIAETVAHEYAHALAWTSVHENLKDHGPLFGVAYSMCYTVAEKFM